MKRERRRRQDRLHLYEGETYRALQARLARNVKRLRERRSWTQEEAAHQLGMSTRLYQRAESREANLTLSTIARISEGFEVDVVELFKRPLKSRTG